MKIITWLRELRAEFLGTLESFPAPEVPVNTRMREADDVRIFG